MLLASGFVGDFAVTFVVACLALVYVVLWLVVCCLWFLAVA